MKYSKVTYCCSLYQHFSADSLNFDSRSHLVVDNSKLRIMHDETPILFVPVDVVVNTVLFSFR